jgi:hypothetical protein
MVAVTENVGRDTFGLVPSDRILSTARPSFPAVSGSACRSASAGASKILQPTKDLCELVTIEVDLSSVRFVVSTGEPLPPVVYDSYRTRVGGIGSTEMLTHFLTNRPGRSRRGSCGTPVAGSREYRATLEFASGTCGEVRMAMDSGVTRESYTLEYDDVCVEVTLCAPLLGSVGVGGDSRPTRRPRLVRGCRSGGPTGGQRHRR